MRGVHSEHENVTSYPNPARQRIAPHERVMRVSHNKTDPTAEDIVVGCISQRHDAPYTQTTCRRDRKAHYRTNLDILTIRPEVWNPVPITTHAKHGDLSLRSDGTEFLEAAIHLRRRRYSLWREQSAMHAYLAMCSCSALIYIIPRTCPLSFVFRASTSCVRTGRLLSMCLSMLVC